MIENMPYLLVNLAKVLMGFDSKKEDLRLSRLLTSLLPSDNLDKNDERRFKLALILWLDLLTIRNNDNHVVCSAT